MASVVSDDPGARLAQTAPLSCGDVKDIRGLYFRSLEESERPREHWRGIDPEEGKTEFLFETVEDDGRRVAIKQMIVHSSGAIDRYWWEHLEDEAGFLADQPADFTDQLDPISPDEFLRLWRG